jgi:transposase
MRAYSLDLRERIVRSVEGGMSKANAARTFEVCLNTVKRLVDQHQETGSLAPKPKPGRPRRVGKDREPELIAIVNANPDATLDEYCQELASGQEIVISESTMCRMLQRVGLSRKKKRR